MIVTLEHLDAEGMRWAQDTVWRKHFLHATVDPRCSPEGWAVRLGALGRVGLLIVGRPEATRCYPWYGSVEDVATGRAVVTRWQVLNLARVWFSPLVQPGGECHGSRYLPGFIDRRGVFRSTLASTAIALMARQVGVAYLLRRPPVYLDEPYEIRWLLSYCDPDYHRGAIYRAARFDLHRINGRGLQTWRRQLPRLTPNHHAAIARASQRSERARRFRAARASQQLVLALV